MELNTLFFNDLSAEDAGNTTPPGNCIYAIRSFSDVATNSLKAKRELSFGFPNDILHREIHNKSLLQHLKDSMQRSAFGLLMSKIKYFDATETPLHIQIRHQDRASTGILFAAISLQATSFGCVISIDVENKWSTPLIEVNLDELTPEGVDSKKQTIANISCNDHIEQWRDSLLDWGAQIATNWKVWELNGMPVVMYPGPLEHPPPHVHLLDPNGSRRTVAKYLVEPFERAKGSNKWDSEMRDFIEQNRESLLRSWELCQRGKKPIAL